jgi:hypothetical protein
MDAELKAKWVAALRSGQYKQNRFNLYHKRTDSFCCLGVLGLLTGKTREEMDCDTDTPEWGHFPHEIELTLASGMNDKGKSFAEIADYIEANL